MVSVIGFTIGLMDSQGYVSLHDLARDCDIKEKNIRNKFHRLLQDGALFEGHQDADPKDCYKIDYKDDRHFEWRINPSRYLAEAPKHAKFAKTFISASQMEAEMTTTDNQTDSGVLSTDDTPPPPDESFVAKRGTKVEPTLLDPFQQALLTELKEKNKQIESLSETI